MEILLPEEGAKLDTFYVVDQDFRTPLETSEMETSDFKLEIKRLFAGP